MKRNSAACGAFLALCAICAGAQTYPVKPLRMMVPAGPGGGVDTITRFVGTPLAAALGQPVVVENRPGAGTMVAFELLAKSPPDMQGADSLYENFAKRLLGDIRAAVG